MFLEDNNRTGERGGALGLWRQGVIETVLNSSVGTQTIVEGGLMIVEFKGQEKILDSSVGTQTIVEGGLMIVELRDKKKYWTRL